MAKAYQSSGAMATLDGQVVADWFWADPELGVVCVPQVHWRTKAWIWDDDGSGGNRVQVMELKGAVTVSEPLPVRGSGAFARDNPAWRGLAPAGWTGDRCEACEGLGWDYCRCSDC